MQNKEFKKRVLNLVSQDKLEKAIEICMDEFDVNGTHYDEIAIISGNFQKWKSDNRKGFDPEDKVLSKIRGSIVDLVNDYMTSVSNVKKVKPDNIEGIEIDKNYPPKEENLNAESLIREKAKREYPNDFEMQRYVIKQQTKALQELKRNKPEDIPEDVFKQIKSKAKEDYPNDFTMQKHIENQQLESYRKIQHKKPEDIPQNIWMQIRNKAEREYSNDFAMQKYIEDNQVASYRNLKQIKLNDIPNDIFKVIYDKATSEYPNDFAMQEYIIKQQVKAYKELNAN